MPERRLLALGRRVALLERRLFMPGRRTSLLDRPMVHVLCCAALVAYALFAIVPACTQPNTNGFAAYFTASRILLDRPEELENVYDNAWFQANLDASGFVHVRDIYNTQPPTMSLLMAPVAWMSPARARRVWVLFNVALWIAGLGLLARSLRLFDGRSASHRLLVLSALTTAYSPIRDNLRYGQCYTLLFFLLCLVFFLALRPGSRSAFAAGVPLGLMLVFKTAGIWLWPLLLLSRRWRVILGATATALAVVVLASPLVGWPAWRAYFHELPRLAVEPSRYVTAYQTVTSLAGHLFVFDSRWNPGPVVHMPALSTFIDLLAGGVALVVSLRAQRVDSRDPGERALSLGMFTSLIVSMAPVAQGYHYVLVLPSLVVAVWWAARERVGPRSWGVLGASALLLTTPLHFVASRSLQTGWLAVLAYPRVYGAFILWGWSVHALGRRHLQPESPPAQPEKDVIAEVAKEGHPGSPPLQRFEHAEEAFEAGDQKVEIGGRPQ